MIRPSILAERAAAVATPKTVAAYQRDGAMCLRGLLQADELPAGAPMAHAFFPLLIGAPA